MYSRYDITPDATHYLPYYILAAVVWVAASAVAGYASTQKNGNFISVFLIALFCSPIFALLYVIAVPAQPAAQTQAGPEPTHQLRPDQLEALNALNNRFDKSKTMTMSEYYQEKKRIEEG